MPFRRVGVPLAGHPPLRTVLALFTHTAPHASIRLEVSFLTRRVNFVSTVTSRLSADRVSFSRVAVCYLLSSGGVTRLLRYYEVIRLPDAVQPFLPVTVVRAFSHSWEQRQGLPGYRVIVMSNMPWSRTPERYFDWPVRPLYGARSCRFVLTSAKRTASSCSFGDFEAQSLQPFGLRPACLRSYA